MEKVLVAKTVANKLMAAEGSVDEALVKVSALLAGLVEAKAELNLSTVFADPAFSKVSEAISALSASRSALVAAHHELEEGKLRIGIRTRMSPVDKPRPFAGVADEAELRAVG